MSQEEDLRENAKEFLIEATLAMERKSFNAAVSLYFKAIAVIADHHLLKKEGRIPSNHTERFRLLQSKYKEIYTILDKVFPIYQDSYRIKLTKAYADVLLHDTQKLISITGIDLAGKDVQEKQ